jgi:hypothetical protein
MTTATATARPDDGALECGAVSAAEIDEYLRAVDEPKRRTLQTLRDTILEVVPDAEYGISYRVPAFRIRGKSSPACRVQGIT